MTLCGPMDYSPKGSSVHGIIQARILEWVAIHFFKGSSWKGQWEVKVKVAKSRQTLCNPMDYAVHGILQARILEWVAFPFPGGLPNPGIKPTSPALQADSLPAESQGVFLIRGSNPGLLHYRQVFTVWATR